MQDIKDSELDSLLPPLRLSRRGFIATSVGAGFSMATGHAAAQTAIRTDATGLIAGPVQITTEDGHIPGYRAMPAGKKNLPVVLVIEEIFGVHEYVQDVTRRLAHMGYLAVAPELFSRYGDPSKHTDMATLRAQVVDKASDAMVVSDLDDTAEWAVTQGGLADKMGAIGFCWGGRQALLYATHNPKLKAVAVFYGPLGGAPSELRPVTALSQAGKVAVPVLGAYGGKDAGIPQADVDKLRVALAAGSAAGKASRIDVYPDAGHGFHADYRSSYNKADAELAWKRAMDWFAEHGLA
jgi:carboxymethylenebutenolidase